MGENEKLGFTFEVKPYDYRTFNRFFGATTDWVEEGRSATTPWNGNPCGRLTVADPTLEQRIARLKSEQECIAEKYKPIADKLMQEIFESSQKPIELLSEETAQRINKAFENIQMTMEKDFPMAFTKRKARKHYKPKFTL